MDQIHMYIFRLSRNLFHIIWNIHTVVGTVCMDNGCKCRFYVQSIKINIFIDTRYGCGVVVTQKRQYIHLKKFKLVNTIRHYYFRLYCTNKKSHTLLLRYDRIVIPVTFQIPIAQIFTRSVNLILT